MEIYTPLEEAVDEIKKRWDDLNLKKEVQKYLKFVPKELLDSPCVFLFRFIRTPNFETIKFIRIAKKIGLKPIFIEYPDDFFCTRNKDKMCLCKLPIYYGKDRNGDNILKYIKILDIEKFEGKPFRKVRTFEGDSLISFHNNFYKKICRDCDLQTINLSQLRKKNNLSAYECIFTLSTFYGVLLENYINKKGKYSYEKDFIKTTITPNFVKIKKKFKREPLISQLLDYDTEDDPSWQCYPAYVERKIKIVNN